jgi:uncharacterized protein (DUF488 family)
VLEKTPGRPEILTVGHGTRSLEEFTNLLLSFNIRLVVDVRTIPRSRHNPQFNRETLPDHLKPRSIGYHHQPGLGGLRKPMFVSVNTGWCNSAFRGFADYMQTEGFTSNINQIIEMTAGQTSVLMCAETLPWRCHRSLIADALLIRKIPVTHLFKAGVAEPHRLTSFARVRGTLITYPSLESQQEI